MKITILKFILLIFFGLAVILLGFIFQGKYLEKRINIQQNCRFKNKTEWRILWYNIPSYLMDEFNYSKLQTHEKHRYFILTKDNNDLSRSDVVIFTHSTMGKIPPPKFKCQIWVFNSMETPTFMINDYQKWNTSLDWLMSYRRDSDIYRPYGSLKKRSSLLVKNYTEVFQKKKYFGVWMSGHCPVPSRRKNYILDLKKYIQVDMFGSCGSAVCLSRTPYLNECLRNFSRDYKFYFAFENNICKDYTTEKLFNVFLGNLDLIPVINGPKNVAEYIPNGTFISTLDFSSPKALANKLKKIGSNETLFIQYLKEKDKYIDIGAKEIFLQSMLQIFDKIIRTEGNTVRQNESININSFRIKKAVTC